MNKNMKVLAICTGLFVLTGCGKEAPEETKSPSPNSPNIVESSESENLTISEDSNVSVEASGDYSVLVDTYNDDTKQMYVIDAEDSIIASIYTEKTNVEGDSRNAVQRYAESVSNEVMTNAESQYSVLINQDNEFVYEYNHDGIQDIYAIVDTGTEDSLIFAMSGTENYQKVRDQISVRVGDNTITLADIQSVLE